MAAEGDGLLPETQDESSGTGRSCKVRGRPDGGRACCEQRWGGSAGVRRPPHVRSCVRGLQQLRHRAADEDLAADHLGALDVEIAEFSADELKRSLV